MNVRFIGAIVAVGVAYAIVLLPLDAIGFGSLGVELDGLALLGAPVAALLAWWLTPAAVSGSWRTAAGVGLGVGALAAPVGVLELAYGSFVFGLAGGPGTSAGGAPMALFIATYGLGFCVFVLPVTIPAGLGWGLVARALIPRLGGSDPGPSPFGLGELAVILAVVAIGAALVPRAGV